MINNSQHAGAQCAWPGEITAVTQHSSQQPARAAALQMSDTSADGRAEQTLCPPVEEQCVQTIVASLVLMAAAASRGIGGS